MSMAALRWARGVRGISSTQKLVLWALADMANDYAEAWPTAIGLAEDCCLSERAVREAFDAIEAAGLMTGTRATGRAARWVLHLDRSAPEPRAVPPAPSSATPAPRSGVRDATAPRSATPAAASGVSTGDPGTSFRTTPERGSDPPRNVVPVTPERGSDRTLKNPHRTPREPSVSARGARLPDGWVPGEADAAFARSLGLDARRVGAGFADYWRARPGQGGVKLDWSATWRNWCRREAERGAQRLPQKPASKLGWMLEAEPAFDLDLTAERVQ